MIPDKPQPEGSDTLAMVPLEGGWYAHWYRKGDEVMFEYVGGFFFSPSKWPDGWSIPTKL